MNAEPIIQIQNLTLQTGSNRLLTDINWTINRGENWIVFGRNGSGKTTLLSTLVGFHKFQRGSLKINGIEFSAENMLQLRQEIGWVSNSFFAQYYRNEKVLDIVLSSWTGTLGVSSFPEDRAVVRAKQLLTELGLRAKIEMPYSTLSKGEQQKVIIARAFLTDPKILIFDEPETGLDVVTREKLSNMIQELSKSDNMTIIYVTHYLEEILTTFDNCLLLKQGTIYKQGKTAQLFSSDVMSDFLNTQSGGRMHITIGRE